MNKRVLYIGLSLAVMLGVFLFGPSVGQFLYQGITPTTTLEAWRKEFGRLDESFPRTAANESRRLDILRRLAQRGIYLDRGLRDESIEHNITPYTLFVMTCWHWEEFLGIP